ncbi:MAG: phosphoribosylanthranilate isomerase [Candidatus Accumulibacter sp.]|jgi:phosphoribosylanthranilate isomerase|nr:phosphoribosylanthranilate isomerase [Accumulibacter sp.]
MRTRIKICGLTRFDDVSAAAKAGADAVGFVFHPPSPRFVALEAAAELSRRAPPFITLVGLFVNADPRVVRETLAAVPLHVLQFHGDEDEAYCRQFKRPYIKALRVAPGVDLLARVADFPSAQAILLDAFVESYGGGGRVFDWSLIPQAIGKSLILSGGVNAGNVAEAIARVRPAALDVSTGVESEKGIKDAQKIREFVNAVRVADGRDDRIPSNGNPG